MYVSNLEVQKCEDNLIYMITITEKQNRETTSSSKGKRLVIVFVNAV